LPLTTNISKEEQQNITNRNENCEYIYTSSKLVT